MIKPLTAITMLLIALLAVAAPATAEQVDALSEAEIRSHRPAWAPCYRPSVPAGVARRKCLICRLFAQSGECSWALRIAYRESRYHTHRCDYLGGDHCGLFQLSGSLRRTCGTYDRRDPNWRKFRAYRHRAFMQIEAAYCVYLRAEHFYGNGRQPWGG